MALQPLVLHFYSLFYRVKKVLGEVEEDEWRSFDQLNVNDVVGEEFVVLAQCGAFFICQHRV